MGTGNNVFKTYTQFGHVSSGQFTRPDLSFTTENASLEVLWINPLKTKRRPFYLKPQSVPRCKQFSSPL